MKIYLLVVIFLISSWANAQSVRSALTKITKVNFEVFGLCISGWRNDWLEVTTVDAMTDWACAHYTSSYKVFNSRIGESLQEEELLKKNLNGITSALKKSGKREIDILIFGHNNEFDKYMPGLMRVLQKRLGHKVSVRFVYDSGCYGLDTDKNLKALSETFVGHREWDFGPFYTPVFLSKWFEGPETRFAVASANHFINRRPFTSTDAAHDLNVLFRLKDAPVDNDPRAFVSGNSRLSFLD
ncbi:MAG: hypothetical protein ACJ76H_00010 [Bacteriovoracaceae bacterium]